VSGQNPLTFPLSKPTGLALKLGATPADVWTLFVGSNPDSRIRSIVFPPGKPPTIATSTATIIVATATRTPMLIATATRTATRTPPNTPTATLPTCQVWPCIPPTPA